VPRAKPFNRSHLKKRQVSLEVDPHLIKTLIDKVPLVTDEAIRSNLEYELKPAIRAYRVRMLADSQERPARIVAALKRGLNPATSLLEWLNSLPQSLRQELRAGGVELLLHELAILTQRLKTRVEDRVCYWQGHVETHRPAGEGDASLDLRRSLTEIITKRLSDAPAAAERQKRANERRRRRWVADACREIGARYPNEKKNRRRFTGER